MLPIRYTYAVLLPYVIIILLASSDGGREKRGVQKELARRHSFLGPGIKIREVKIHGQWKKKKKKLESKLDVKLKFTLKSTPTSNQELPFPYDSVRIGQGYDIHQIRVSTPEDITVDSSADANKQNFKRLTIGGVQVDTISVLSHSDGDVIYHALVDALLGGMNCLDLGTLFPDGSEKYKNKKSISFLRYARLLLYKKNYAIANLDIIVIAEIPKISPIREEIVRNISSALGISESQVSLKGKTHEKLGPIGQKKAIECFANALLIRKKSEKI
ncbi:2C-methyl-D-erythritol 2,4-cyclodiphosphate synthase, putative [Plasmodium knowlesi strain H]|uniref:2-C-methyl-D-erythritol 2,4-cyclodiphosphate synthase n=3 Tax=Plasmodium knowlesi TaxID=5850 RepID=A0A5K1UIK5_PLAKH|nr:2C-methyl-D-erythritol 2,4-cyclodiphosphate synthase, putative [Plasmodium knowlesi strain H]OTN66841.1 2-C-methyl-D-erythritol 2 - 4-cyclodiphosphate synthase [Plasmodium knowlesi]CAA9986758.1 2C-methyl-D-erythritol 2,4-cyclodiphosphate synthase, putative [Plasmodium knowlesi strain H]SBO23586.1 2C-methyl-D-erythritol 2,4-cyclodiphosphate synthase, putative [Plasmodium knowlesi strain H]SBO25134.1 2C-methyl-D-erythritol 2,4-cyclodiphosphate synthase, putative [Plasmodium knowlesi strain H]|eukprot:XP_002257942.1 2C-methyl-D-erythritol 2,4-cyclodiphosphate synthase, putative [Plasmodium knowlesi strain H]